MDRQSLVAYFRKRTQDEQAAPLWSDEEIWQYIREAELAAGACKLIYDKSSALCSIPAVDGQSSYAIDPLFYEIELVYIDGKSIRAIDREDFIRRNVSLPKGSVGGYFIDEDGSLVFDRPPPDSALEIKIAGWRYPLPMTADDSACEIPEQWQIKMLEWAFYLAKQKEDPQTERPADAAKHYATFEQYFAPMRSATQLSRQQKTTKRYQTKYGSL